MIREQATATAHGIDLSNRGAWPELRKQWRAPKQITYSRTNDPRTEAFSGANDLTYTGQGEHCTRLVLSSPNFHTMPIPL